MLKKTKIKRRRHVIPGLGMTLGITLTYLSLMVLIPLAGLAIKSSSLSFSEFWDIITNPRVLASLKVSFGAAFIAALINCFFGFIVAWVLVRYNFPGRRLFDAIVDLPFAMPTAVSGIALTALYAPNGWIGKLLGPDIKVAYAWPGVIIALTFIGLPFIVRTLQPALEELDKASEEAAGSLGASRWQTFRMVIIPELFPSLLTGFALAFARAIGEYGSVIFIAGNIPMKTEIAPLLIVIKLEQYDFIGAAALAVVMLMASFILLFVINILQAWARRRIQEGSAE
ncbi:MAG: sulfate ABC transporter permease subunit CysT [Acidobacteria bacterium]|nr:sulfate ABC transporter permease subunit CysT [Acidobacteriota bacterium]